MKDQATPSTGVIFDLVEPSSNTSLTIADHLLVSKEAQAIIGGVVGFWGGVFGMGLVYLLVVFLRRLRTNLHNHRKNTAPSIPKPDKSRISGGYSAMFGHARTDNNLDLMDISSAQHHTVGNFTDFQLDHYILCKAQKFALSYLYKSYLHSCF